MDFSAALQKALKGSLHRGSDAFWHTDFLPSGIPSVDHALGGGIGYGRLSEVFGNWSTGKTVLLYAFLSANQKSVGVQSGKPGISFLFEAEGAFDSDFYRHLGGDPDALWVYPVDTCEEVFNGIFAIAKLMKGKLAEGDDTPVCIGWDGIAATGTKHLLETSMETRDMSKAGVMAFGTSKIVTAVKSTRVIVMATNQTRSVIGSNSSEVHTPGGAAWPFHSSQRILLTFSGGYKGSRIVGEDGEFLGRWIKGEVVKSKLAPPFKQFSLPLYVRKYEDDPTYVHPTYGYPLRFGIDSYESLYYYYEQGKYKLPDGSPVLKVSGGWVNLHEKVGKCRFRAKEWPRIVQEFPVLWTLLYKKDFGNDITEKSTEASAGLAAAEASGDPG